MASYLIPVTADGGFSQTPAPGEPAIEFATEAYVGTSIANLVDTAPTTLNTLNELAAALNDDENFAATVTTALSNKANTSSLAAVATSGSYTDLSNKPTIPTSFTSIVNGSHSVSLASDGVLTLSTDSSITIPTGGLQFNALASSSNTVNLTSTADYMSGSSATRNGTSLMIVGRPGSTKIADLLLLTAGSTLTITTNLGTETVTLATVFSSDGFSPYPTYTATSVESAAFSFIQGNIVFNLITSSIQPSVAISATGLTFSDSTEQTTAWTGSVSYNDLTDKPTIPTNTNELTNGAGFITSNGIPSQTGNTGKYLTTDGTSVSWGTVSSGPTNYFKGLQILEDVYEASGAANIIFESTDNSVTITRNANALDFTVAGGGSGLPSTATAQNGYVLGFDGYDPVWKTFSPSDLLVNNNSIFTQGEYDHFLVWDHVSAAWNIESGPVTYDRIFSGQLQSIKIGTSNSGIINATTDTGSIVLTTQNNSSYTNSSYMSGFYVDPVRNDDTPAQMLYYNTTTKEITYGAASGGVSLPSQTGNSGKFLTTNGSTLSWATVSSGSTSAFADTFKFDLQTSVSGMSTVFTLPTSAGASSYFFVNAYIPGPMGTVPYVTGISAQLTGSWSPTSVSGGGPGNYFISTTAPTGMQAAMFSDTHNGSVYLTMFQITSEERTMSLYVGSTGVTPGMGGEINIISEPTYNGGMPWMTLGNFYGRIFVNGGSEMWSQLATFVPVQGVEAYVDEINFYVWIKVPGSIWSQGGGAGSTIGTITQSGYFSATIQGTYFGN